MFNRGGSKTVTQDNALELSDVLTCVRVLAESVASLPLCVYEKTEVGGKKAYDLELYDLLRYEPNPEMTSYDLRLWMMIDALLRGNGCAQLIRDGAGKVIQIWPLYSSKLKAERSSSGEIVYNYPDKDKKEGVCYLQSNEVLLIRTFSSNELFSPSLITEAASMLSSTKGADDYTLEFFQNGTTLSGVIEFPTEMDEETFQRLKTDWSSTYTGDGNRHKTPILEGGAKFSPLVMNHTETQLLEARKYNRSQIAGLFRVPAHLINDLEKATFSNIEHQDLGFVKHTLRPWMCNWEQKLRQSLLTEEEKKKYYFKHNTNDLLRGDLESRFKAYSSGVQNGFLSPNDVRRKEDEPTYEGGDTYIANSTLRSVQVLTGAGTNELQAQAVLKSADVIDEVVAKTYSDYPQAASNNAKRALKYKDENGSSCGTPVGWTRANQLASREALSRDTIARMASFKRHQQNKDVPYDEGCGGIMWDCWGGSSGIEWAIKKLKQIDKEE